MAVGSLDHLTRLAASLLDAPLSFLTVVDDERSYWASCTGVTDGTRQNTVEESFCRYVIADRAPLVVDDAAVAPADPGQPVGRRAWACAPGPGYPVLDPDGHALGSFCVVDTVPRAWTAKEVQVLGVLAEAASAHLAVLSEARGREDARENLDKLRAVSDGLTRMASVSLQLGEVAHPGGPGPRRRRARAAGPRGPRRGHGGARRRAPACCGCCAGPGPSRPGARCSPWTTRCR